MDPKDFAEEVIEHPSHNLGNMTGCPGWMIPMLFMKSLLQKMRFFCESFNEIPPSSLLNLPPNLFNPFFTIWEPTVSLKKEETLRMNETSIRINVILLRLKKPFFGSALEIFVTLELLSLTWNHWRNFIHPYWILLDIRWFVKKPLVLGHQKWLLKYKTEHRLW